MASNLPSSLSLLLMVSASIVCNVGAISRPSEVTLENNEFRNLLVAIHPSVPEDPTLIQNIQDTFSKASTYLYEATKQRAVFRDITILVPNTWSDSSAYQAASSQVLINADVLFTNPPTSDAPDPAASKVQLEEEEKTATPDGFLQFPEIPRHAATTKAYAGCGHPGVRITLTTDVVMNSALSRTLGPPERVLVHEWARFRWGVFDEYALPGEPQFYYSPTSGELEGVRCTEKIKGIITRVNPQTGRPEYCRNIDPSTGLYPAGCEFRPYPSGPATVGVEASIMDRVLIPPIKSFCDDDASNDATVHNYDAPSRHNRLCGHRSTWAVISESQDFENGRNPPRQGLDPQPTFTVVKAPNSRRMVLALDTSNSMQEDNKLVRMRQAVGTFIKEAVAPDTQVGLTTFSSTAQVRRAPTPLNTSEDRQSFADDLPDTAQDATDITSALITSTEVLHKNTASTSPPSNSSSNGTTPAPSGFPTDGGHVVVVTDGQDTLGPNLTSALPMLHDARVVVSFIVLGGPPHPDLQNIALVTGGRVYCDSNHPESTALTDAFFDVKGMFETDTPTSPIQLLSRAAGLNTGETLEGTVTVDRDVGNSTTFLVAFTHSLPQVEVTSPSGRLYSALYPEYSVDHRLQIASIRIPLTAETGLWHYSVVNPGVLSVLSVLVLSSARTSSVPPVRLSGSLVLRRHAQPITMHIFAELSQGLQAVSNLKVMADVYAPDGNTVQVELMDNGAGADIVEGDGVYSRFFSRFTVPGVYTVRLSATGHHEDTKGSPLYYVERTASAGYFIIDPNDNTTNTRASDSNPDEDMEAPVRISDLRVIETSGRNRTVVLSWRASGDDTDHETASQYEVLMGPTVADLMKQSSLVQRLTQNDVLHGNLVAPKPFGVREFLKIRIPQSLDNNGSYVITVVAIDDAGNKGDHSNYVTVGLGNVPDVSDREYWGQGEDKWQAATTNLQAPKNQRMVIAGLLGTMSGLLVLVILVTLVAMLCTKGHRDPELPTVISKAENEVKVGRQNGQEIALSDKC